MKIEVSESTLKTIIYTLENYLINCLDIDEDAPEMVVVAEYIKYLQELKKNHGDIEIEINKEIEGSDLSTVDTYETAEKPYYNKKRNSVIIYREFDIYR